MQDDVGEQEQAGVDTNGSSAALADSPSPGASTAAAVLAELEAAASATGASGKLPRRLPLGRIVRQPELFQPRDGLSEFHVDELKRALGIGGELDPVLVIQVGPDAVLVDGHHRVAAYEAAGWDKTVPVDYFRGTVRQAVLEAGKANNKAKLPMTTQDRMNAAWRLTRLGGYKKAETAAFVGISERQVAIMRKALKSLGTEGLGIETWEKARLLWQDRTLEPLDDIDEWVDAQARAYADRMSKHLGPKFANNPTIAAKALSIYLGRRLGEIVEVLRWHHLPEEDEVVSENDDF